ncbi:OLC1v1004362C1 [Oldenlandia corymbosa var. corymbosa]|uniref:OLC1v1004362C1 n=1 Tax=Oldenlandia corymbosa var. corymbosa TaxID=529605 RepID=A0AAV1DF43_OLDCO|nr:OLC1v1004362C1 [Oldenlandia corymbosa var. corymbosa]
MLAKSLKILFSKKMLTTSMCFYCTLAVVFLLETYFPFTVLAADRYSRADFPADFVFGAGSSAYQVEGAASEDGRTPSIWDTFAHAGKYDGATGDVACDMYHKYKEDVQLMVNTGLEAFRFSISWSRLIPNGEGPVNPKAVQYYNSLINEIISHGIQPHVTLFHDDLPQALEDKYSGVLSRKFVKDFTAYADVCFKEFGDRVSHWTTFNEANVFVLGGYDLGFLPPCHCSIPGKVDCVLGNSSTEPYIAAHNILLAHASAVKLYREKYKKNQHGSVGLNIFIYWFTAHTNTTNDILATQRAFDYYVGWFLNPLFFGDYPDIMKKNAGRRLPAFTKSESILVKGAIDFVGVNHYTTVPVMDDSSIPKLDVSADMEIRLLFSIVPQESFRVMSSGLYNTLEYLKEVYGNPPIYIHENGQFTPRNGTLNDTSRVEYLHAYIGSLLDALRNGSNTKGYFVWSFLDGLELLDGYKSAYGLYYVDLNDKELKRYPKLSAHCEIVSPTFSYWDNGIGLISLLDIYLPFTVLAADSYSRTDFPADFVFGAGSSAYQVEGAASEDGRTPSIWDTFAHAGKYDGATGDVASDMYHKYKEDVQLMLNTGLEAFRFSISWSRLFPNGEGPVNPKAVQYYNSLINEIVSNGIQPHVTLFHDDLPQALEDKYSGVLSRKFVKDFTSFADACFKEFGDRVSHWTTFNEANAFILGGYDLGFLPPGRCSLPGSNYCVLGNSSTEPYIAAHNILLAHSSAVKLYREKYKKTQHGSVGLNILIPWFTAGTDMKNDILATQRGRDYYIGWFLDPLFFGDYPDIMKKNAGRRLPAFTKSESMLVKGAIDFVGVNHYYTMAVMDGDSSMPRLDVSADMQIRLQFTIRPEGQFPVTPAGLHDTLDYLKQVYGNPPIYIHENGQITERNGTLNDTSRVDYLQAYIGGLLDALRNGSNARGYFVWSFLDGLELLDGYKSAFGLYYVDLNDKELKRYPKLSAHCKVVDDYVRTDFPPDFVFGCGTSAYQVEGAAFEDGRTPSIWDTFAHSHPEGGNGDVACDGYHKYKEDIKLMAEMGLEAYRFSISWSRLLPNGRGPVNPKGLAYYNNLINELISHGIKPYVTLYHIDTPQVLEDEYGGWLSRKIVKDFAAYADVCFKEFGDRVLHWTTLNEPNIFALGGYDSNQMPPGRCSYPFGQACTKGNSTIEPYIALHNMLLAHSTAVKLYKKQYKATQHGFVGINVYSFGIKPCTDSTADVIAAQRALDYYIGWVVNPLIYGDYPDVMKKNSGTRLPAFSAAESKLVKGSFDFFGLNHYTSFCAEDHSSSLENEIRDVKGDMALEIILDGNGQFPPVEYSVLPSGLYSNLEYFKEAYGNPPIFIQENGQKTNRSVTVNDPTRVEYVSAYIGAVLDAIRNGSNTKGYFLWSFLDGYELLDAFKSAYGLIYVDMINDKELKRYPKLSAEWLVTMTILLLLLFLAISGEANFTRDDFPEDFVFGAGTSAYQVEGAAFEDGRLASIWDTYVHADNEFTSVNYNGASGDVACDQYHKYKEDVQLMVDIGLEAYRFSISWARLIPNGNGPVNPKGLEYYNNLINELIKHGIEPHVTLYHLDTPQALEDEYKGWLSPKMVRDFTSYADVCFKEFGDRVSHWTTINEANVFAIGGYDNGLTPPGRCSSPFGFVCTRGNSSTEPYIAAHNMLLAHSSVVKLYRRKYKATQHGFVGLNLFAPWFAPSTNATEDAVATQRTIDFYIGWFLHPLVYGEYPEIIKENAGTRLPDLTSNEVKLVKGSFDFIGMNHYSTIYVTDDPSSLKLNIRDVNADMGSTISWKPNFKPSDQDKIDSSGLYEILEYLKTAYGNPATYVHENGQGTARNGTLEDASRIKYIKSYIGSLLDAVRAGSNSKGYFLWSFLDGFELMGGYKVGFGLCYVDLDDKQLRRYPKLSAQWYSNFLKGRNTKTDNTIEIQNTNSISSASEASH